jgi:hypothetical protein
MLALREQEVAAAAIPELEASNQVDTDLEAMPESSVLSSLSPYEPGDDGPHESLFNSMSSASSIANTSTEGLYTRASTFTSQTLTIDPNLRVATELIQELQDSNVGDIRAHLQMMMEQHRVEVQLGIVGPESIPPPIYSVVTSMTDTL